MFKHIQINKYYYLLLINKKMTDELIILYVIKIWEQSIETIFEYKSREIVDRIYDKYSYKKYFSKKKTLYLIIFILPDIKSCLLVRHP